MQVASHMLYTHLTGILGRIHCVVFNPVTWKRTQARKCNERWLTKDTSAGEL